MTKEIYPKQTPDATDNAKNGAESPGTENKVWQDREKIISQPIGRALLQMAVPAVLSTFFTVIFEIIDMFWIGKLGAVAIAGLSASSFFVWMMRGLGLIVATGSIALISRRSGEKDEKGVLATIFNSITATFIFAILMIMIFFPIAINVFQWINLEASVAASAEDYAIVFLSGLFFVYLMMTFEFIIRGIGDTRTPMIITGISLFLNAILDPIFIFTLGMGLKGAAYATILAQALGAVLMTFAVFKKIPDLKGLTIQSITISLKDFGRKFRTLITIGGPVGLSDAGFSLIYLLLSGIISIYGKEPLAAVGIAHRIEALPFFISLGFSMAVAPMVGQYLGAGKLQEAKHSIYLSLKITSAIMITLSILYYIFAPQLFDFFTDNPAIIAHGVRYLRIVAPFEIFLAFELILSGAFSGAGDTRPPFLIVFPLTILRVPAAYVLAVYTPLGISTIWFVIAITMMLKGSLLFYIFKKGKWMKKKV
jgi:putative MATE family efflux protein